MYKNLSWKEVKDFVKEHDLKNCELEHTGLSLRFVTPESEREAFVHYPPVAEIITGFDVYSGQYKRSWIVKGKEIKEEFFKMFES